VPHARSGRREAFGRAAAGPAEAADAAPRPAEPVRAPAGRMGRRRLPDLSGKTIGTWRILHDGEVEAKRQCMCQCVRCGIRKIIPTVKLWQGYALRCQECRLRLDLVRT
jgi:hypothetical protein